MKNMKLYGIAGVAALAAVGGTFAYYSASQTFNNPFNTTNYSTQSTEKFNPSGDNNDWKPGVEVDKEVYATNTGEGDVWVRIKFDEKWTLGNNTIKSFTSADDGFNTASGATAGDNQVSETDGEVDADSGSVVFKEFVNSGDWYVKGGYYYYKSVLRQGESTTKLLDSVTLCGDADMGLFHDNAYYIVLDEEPTEVPKYSADDTRWNVLPEGGLNPEDANLKGKYVYTYKENKLDDEKQGYANKDYELNITVEFVQTDKDGEAADAADWDVEALKEAGLIASN